MERPRDPFADLGAEGKTAGERLAERDRTHPEPVERRPETPRPGSRYAWIVGIVFLVAVVIAGVTTIPNRGEGLFGPDAGSRMPRFAAPLALSRLEGNANVCQRRPCPRESGRTPACELRSEEVLNVCALWRKPLVLTFIFDRGADCFPQVDRVERMKREVRGVNFPVVYFSRKDRAEVREIVRRRGWTMPVGVDQDGAVVNLYGIGGCPTTVFAFRGGRVKGTALGPLTERRLRSEATALLR